MSGINELIAAAELGEKARDFLESELGKILIGLADQEIRVAEEALGEVDPDDPKKIRELQNNIKVGKWFTKWLLDLVQDGDQALSVFQQQRSE